MKDRPVIQGAPRRGLLATVAGPVDFRDRPGATVEPFADGMFIGLFVGLCVRAAVGAAVGAVLGVPSGEERVAFPTQN